MKADWHVQQLQHKLVRLYARAIQLDVSHESLLYLQIPLTRLPKPESDDAKTPDANGNSVCVDPARRFEVCARSYEPHLVPTGPASGSDHGSFPPKGAGAIDPTIHDPL